MLAHEQQNRKWKLLGGRIKGILRVNPQHTTAAGPVRAVTLPRGAGGIALVRLRPRHWAPPTTAVRRQSHRHAPRSDGPTSRSEGAAL